MTIVASGNVISMGGNVQLSGFNESIEYELKASYGNTTTGTSQISMNDSAVRGLANIATGAISLANLYGKSSVLTKYVAIITAGTAVTLPTNWNTANCTIEVIGGGQGGGLGSSTGTGRSGAGGAGGSYAKISNFGSPSTSYTISVGQGSNGTSTTPANGGNTWLSNTGIAPTTTSQGVLAAGGGLSTSIGTVTFTGGGGGARFRSGTSITGGGGGGAGGPNAAGINGVAATSSIGGNGGQGDGTNGGAGGSGDSGTGDTAGNPGTEWTASINTLSGTGLTMLSPSTLAGSGGGGGGASPPDEVNGGDGGEYGAGGGGGIYNSSDLLGTNGGIGTNGLIVLTWYA